MILIYQACYAPLWRQGFDKSEPYRELSNKQNKGDFHFPECRFPLIRNLDFIRQEYPPFTKGIIQWNGDTYQGKHQPIIDELTYAKVDKKYKSTKWQRGKGSMRRPYQVTQLLSSLMYCENCGARYFAKGNYSGHGDKKRYYPYYYCYSRAKNRKSFVVDPNCKNPVYAVEKLDLIIINEIKKLATNDKYIYEAQNESNKNDNDLSQIKIYQKRLTDIDKQITRMLDLYQLGTIQITDINSRLTALQDEKTSIEYQIAEINNQIVKLPISEVKKILRNIKSTFETGEFQEKRNVILSLINKIIINSQQGEFKIYWNF